MPLLSLESAGAIEWMSPFPFLSPDPNLRVSEEDGEVGGGGDWINSAMQIMCKTRAKVTVHS